LPHGTSSLIDGVDATPRACEHRGSSCDTGTSPADVRPPCLAPAATARLIPSSVQES
jgi:hypothetical protein